MAPPLFPPGYDYSQLDEGVVNQTTGAQVNQTNAGLMKLLKKAGVPDAEIARFIATKTASPAISKILSPGQLHQLSTGTPLPSMQKSVPNTPPANNSILGNLKPGYDASRVLPSPPLGNHQAFSAPVNQSPVGSFLGKLSDSLKIPLAGAASLGGTAQATGVSSRQAALNNVLGMISKGAGTADQIARQSALNKVLGIVSTGANKAGAIQSALASGQGTVGAPTMDSALGTSGGALDTFTPATVAPRDFSAEANTIAGNAYQPLYDAIAKGKTNAQGQYNTSDVVVKGLYDKLVNDTKASGVTQAAQYDQSGTDAAARAQALQDRTGQIYQQSNQGISGLLGNLGQSGAAGQVLGQNAGEQAFQQSQAAAQGTAQQNYYGAAKQNSLDQTTGTANAQNTQGVVSREGLVNDLSKVLNQYDQQALQTKGQQANAAIGIGQNLTSQDLSAQGTNASNSLGAFNANQSAQQNAIQNQNQSTALQYQMQQDSLANARADAGLTGIYNGQPTLDAAAALARAQAAGTSGTSGTGLDLQQYGAPNGKADTLPGPGAVVATADTVDPGKGNSYLALFNGIINGTVEPSFDINTTNLQQFAALAAAKAKANGLNPSAAFISAATFWQKVMNRS